MTCAASGPTAARSAPSPSTWPARSISTRQGNPAWAGQDRDGPRRTGRTTCSSAARGTDWVEPDQGPHPAGGRAAAAARQPDHRMDATGSRCPRFWYFPGPQGGRRGDRRRPRHGRTSGRFSTYAAASPSGCSVDQLGVPPLHVLRVPGHAADQRRRRLVQRPGFRGRSAPPERLRQLRVVTEPRGHLHRASSATGARVPGCPRRPPAASTASCGATGSPRPRPSSRTGSGSTPTTTTTPARGSPTGPAS